MWWWSKKWITTLSKRDHSGFFWKKHSHLTLRRSSTNLSFSRLYPKCHHLWLHCHLSLLPHEADSCYAFFFTPAYASKEPGNILHSVAPGVATLIQANSTHTRLEKTTRTMKRIHIPSNVKKKNSICKCLVLKGYVSSLEINWIQSTIVKGNLQGEQLTNSDQPGPPRKNRNSYKIHRRCHWSLTRSCKYCSDVQLTDNAKVESLKGIDPYYWPNDQVNSVLKATTVGLCWQKVQVPRICLKFGEPVGRATRWTGAKNGGSYALLLSLSSLVNFKTLEGAPSIHAQETVDIYIHYRILLHVYV